MEAQRLRSYLQHELILMSDCVLDVREVAFFVP